MSLYDVALKNDRQAYGRVAAAQVVFKDAAGNVLARGSVEPPHGVFSIDHPAVGDCRREERAAAASAEAMRAWKSCFEAQSRWLPHRTHERAARRIER